MIGMARKKILGPCSSYRKLARMGFTTIEFSGSSSTESRTAGRPENGLFVGYRRRRGSRKLIVGFLLGMRIA